MVFYSENFTSLFSVKCTGYHIETSLLQNSLFVDIRQLKVKKKTVQPEGDGGIKYYIASVFAGTMNSSPR